MIIRMTVSLSSNMYNMAGHERWNGAWNVIIRIKREMINR